MKVYVYVGHGHPLRIQKPLEDEVVLDWVDIGYSEAVGNEASRSGSPAGADGYSPFLGMRDKVLNDQKVRGVAHVLDHPKLPFQPFLANRIAFPSEALSKPCPGLSPKDRTCALTGRKRVLGQVDLAYLQLDLTATSNEGGILHRLGYVFEGSRHLLRRFQVELVAAEGEPLRIVQVRAGLYGQQNLMGSSVVPGQVMAVVGCHQGDSEPFGQVYESGVHRILFRNPVPLDLDEEVFPAEDIEIPAQRFFGHIGLALQEAYRRLSFQTPCQSDEPFGIASQSLQVHTGFVVEAFQEPDGYYLHEVQVPCLILRQEDQMVRLVAKALGLVQSRLTGKVYLASQNGLYSGGLARFVETDHPVHHAVIRDGQRVHTHLLGQRRDLAYSAGAVQQAVFRVNV